MMLCYGGSMQNYSTHVQSVITYKCTCSMNICYGVLLINVAGYSYVASCLIRDLSLLVSVLVEVVCMT